MTNCQVKCDSSSINKSQEVFQSKHLRGLELINNNAYSNSEISTLLTSVYFAAPVTLSILNSIFSPPKK